ncbi:ketoacyl-ACP synthase III [Gelidibacter japonicus]|uniref:ketoacyl-ACP synthase III n=1 Tax=Gelidibacter japonicus TaxID=1962232 RepID=UPI003A8D1090
MIGIKNIGTYIPETRVSNFDRKEEFGIDDSFIVDKIGIQSVAKKAEDEETSDLCVKAFQNLLTKQELNLEEIEVAIVVTQNPDYNLPHTASLVHKKIGLPESVASFDISLGCSGFVYGLSVIESFMKQHGMKKGLLFTADPYSKILNPNDKNTSLLFGDAATVTLIGEDPIFTSGKSTFGTIGEGYGELICTDDLYMNGRSIFNFAARYVPKDVKKVLLKNNLSQDEIDLFIFHQGSKYICDTLIKRIGLDESKVPFDAGTYGNTVSSSIPIILKKYLEDSKEVCSDKTLICGFGVGLSWASTILHRNKTKN